MDENSERHSTTTTYSHKLNLGVDMAYDMRHALTGFAQTWTNLTLVLENSWNLKKVPFVLELSWNFVKLSLKI